MKWSPSSTTSSRNTTRSSFICIYIYLYPYYIFIDIILSYHIIYYIVYICSTYLYLRYDRSSSTGSEELFVVTRTAANSWTLASSRP